MNENGIGTQRILSNWFYFPVVLVTLIFAFYLRTVGLDWDEGYQLHPDERFLNMVQGSTKWVGSIDEYFNTEQSSLNPNNRGHGFYVYGTLPLFITRGIIELLEPELRRPHMVGRWLSCISDLLTVLLTILIAGRLYGRVAAVIAGILVACCVTQIQQAHFGVVDSFTGVWVTFALYLAVVISQVPPGKYFRLIILSALFGFAAGCAAASKIPAGLISLWIGPALLMRSRNWKGIVAFSILAAFVCLLTFRIAQPYAFAGPDFWGVGLNPKWVSNIKELSNQGNLSFGFPPSIQWMERDKSYAFVNMYSWGVGELPSLLILAAILFCIYRLLVKREWVHFLPLTWAIAAFGYFGVLTVNPTLRYQIPAYPGMFICAAALGAILMRAKLGKIVLVLTLMYSTLWAVAFTRIYTRQHSRVEASHWIVRHVPGAVNLVGYQNNERVTFPISVASNFDLVPGEIKNLQFGLPNPFGAEGILVPLPGFEPGADRIELTAWLRGGAGASAVVASGRGVLANDEVITRFPDMVEVSGYTNYALDLQSQGHAEPIPVRKLRIAHETPWDDGLPMRVLGLDPYGGIYEGDLTLEVYWEESPESKKRFADVLAKADYFFITSNRQWGSVGRLPKNYPSAQKLYRTLLDCDPTLTVPQCYAAVRVPPRESKLGFELVKVFESYPGIFGMQFNDQLADEAFTVYDHPKVLLFKNVKRLNTEALLGALQ